MRAEHDGMNFSEVLRRHNSTQQGLISSLSLIARRLPAASPQTFPGYEATSYPNDRRLLLLSPGRITDSQNVSATQNVDIAQ
jgi:hypothetical protein